IAEGRLPEEPDEVVVGYQFRKNLADASVDEEDIWNDNGEVKSEYQYEGDIIGKELDMMVKKLEDGEHVTHTIPVTVVGKLSEPTKEWVLDQNVYISQSVLSEVEEFTGTRRGEPDPQYANEPS